MDYIVIDGCSTDRSVEIIKKYEDTIIENSHESNEIGDLKFSKGNHLDASLNRCSGTSFRWISEKDRGHGEALNKGFSLARGEILAWINSDDMYHPGALNSVNGIFAAFPEISWLTGKSSWWDKSGRQVDSSVQYKNMLDFLAGRYQWIQQESTFWRRSLWQKAGGFINTSYKYMVDGELWCRFFLISELWHVAECLGGYRVHESNRARLNYAEIIREMERAVSELAGKAPIESIRLAEILRRREYGKLSSEITNAVNYRIVEQKDGTWQKFAKNYFVQYFMDLENSARNEVNEIKSSRTYLLARRLASVVRGFR